MKILITGCHGFIGNNLSILLKKKKNDLYGIGNPRKNIKENSFNYIKTINGTIEKNKIRKFKIKFDFAVHCAGSGKVGLSKNMDYHKNINSTIGLLEYARLYNRKLKIILLSSAAVYGNNKTKFTEKTNINPISIYGKNKFLAEKKCHAYSKKFKLNITILRLTSIFGKGLDKQLIFECCKKINSKKYIFFGTGNEKRDWLHIDDLNILIHKMIKKKKDGLHIYNCGSGKQYKVKNVVKYISKKMNNKIILKFDGKGLDKNPSSNLVSINKLKEFDWKPKKNFWKALSDYVNWYKRNK